MDLKFDRQAKRHQNLDNAEFEFFTGVAFFIKIMRLKTVRPPTKLLSASADSLRRTIKLLLSPCLSVQ